MQDDYEPSESTWPRAQPVAEPADPAYVPAQSTAVASEPSSVPEEQVPAEQVLVVPTRRRFAFGPAGRLRELVWLALIVVDAFLVADFILRALAVGRDQFVGTVEHVGSVLAAPFSGLFGHATPHLGRTNDWALLLAAGLYILAAWIVSRVLEIVGRADDEAVPG